jgi:hypothetical protein
MVDACDAYVLTVYPFGRDDEQPDDYELEDWETGMMVGSGFKVNGYFSLVVIVLLCLHNQNHNEVVVNVVDDAVVSGDVA